MCDYCCDSLAQYGAVRYDTLTHCAELARVIWLGASLERVVYKGSLGAGAKKPPSTEVGGGKIWMLQQLEAEAKTGHDACIVFCCIAPGVATFSEDAEAVDGFDLILKTTADVSGWT